MSCSTKSVEMHKIVLKIVVGSNEFVKVLGEHKMKRNINFDISRKSDRKQ